MFSTKYRKPVLKGEIATDVRALMREPGHVRPDHVHLLLSVPPQLAPSRVMQTMVVGRLRRRSGHPPDPKIVW